jgi:hypothetical protein
MQEIAFVIVSGLIGLTTFYLIARKFGKDCIP